MRRRIGCPTILILGLMATALPASGQVKVFVTIQPLAYVVERIGGSNVSVYVLISPGQNYHVYEPTPRQLASLASCQVLFRVGTPMEDRLLEKIRGSGAVPVVVDTARGVELRAMAERESQEHDGHGHEAGAEDPHVWMSPANGRTMAANVCQGLKQIDPGNAAAYETGLDSLEKELSALDGRIHALLDPFKGRSIYVNHPAFGYFTDAYGLRQVSIEVEGKEPSARQLAALVSQARADGVKKLYVQRQFSKSSAETLAKEIGAETVYLDPLSGDYLNNLEEIARLIRKGFES